MSSEPVEDNREPRRAQRPGCLLRFGLVALLWSALLATRYIWEQTVMTWEGGEQMVGFSLIHSPGFVLIFFPMMLMAWLVIAAVIIVRDIVKHRRVPWGLWPTMGLSIAVLIVLQLPYRFWERLCVRHLASSPRAAQFIGKAALNGDLDLVKALVAAGVPVNAREHHGWTPIRDAAAGGYLPVVEYLVSMGADVNVVDRFGDSPLEMAAGGQHEDVASFLADRGAIRLRGDDAFRKQVWDDVIREELAADEARVESRRR